MKNPGESVVISHLEVTPRPGESADRLVRRFSRKVRADGVLQEVYERRSYVKPSDARRRKRARARSLAHRATD